MMSIICMDLTCEQKGICILPGGKVLCGFHFITQEEAQHDYLIRS